MRGRKKLVGSGSCHLSRVPSTYFLNYQPTIRLIVFKLRYVCKEPKCSKDFETIGTGDRPAISPYSKIIHKQDNIKITPPKNLIAGVREYEFWFIKFRCFVGCDSLPKLAGVCRENPFMEPLPKSTDDFQLIRQCEC